MLVAAGKSLQDQSHRFLLIQEITRFLRSSTNCEDAPMTWLEAIEYQNSQFLSTGGPALRHASYTVFGLTFTRLAGAPKGFEKSRDDNDQLVANPSIHFFVSSTSASKFVAAIRSLDLTRRDILRWLSLFTGSYQYSSNWLTGTCVHPNCIRSVLDSFERSNLTSTLI